MLKTIVLDPSMRQPLLKSGAHRESPAKATNTKVHPRDGKIQGGPDGTKGSLYFIGTATTLLEWEGIRLMTDPNFLHAGDHVHLGPGVTSTRRTDPAVELTNLPQLNCILLSHYHEDHFDQDVEKALDRNFLIITTPHAKDCLVAKEDPFVNVQALDFFDHVCLQGGGTNSQEMIPSIKVTGMPGKHVPPGLLSTVNDFLQAVPPTNGWMVELGYSKDNQPGKPMNLDVRYRIYISGDTLFVDDLKQIPEWLQGERIDLMIIHLGGTSIPGPSAPMIMVTMDGTQGLKMMRLMNPDMTVPVHYDDYDVFKSPLDAFKEELRGTEMEGKVTYLDRGEKYVFRVPEV